LVRKYAYVFSAGMDTGVALSAIIIFFAVQYHDRPLSWWATTFPPPEGTAPPFLHLLFRMWGTSVLVLVIILSNHNVLL
jgi:hypothetical protein